MPLKIILTLFIVHAIYAYESSRIFIIEKGWQIFIILRFFIEKKNEIPNSGTFCEYKFFIYFAFMIRQATSTHEFIYWTPRDGGKCE